MPRTIKEVLEDLLWGEYDSERDKLEESMAEIRQLLKEAEPVMFAMFPSGLPPSEQNAVQHAIKAYTANIEKRLG